MERSGFAMVDRQQRRLPALGAATAEVAATRMGPLGGDVA